jgi:hypothetical protein
MSTDYTAIPKRSEAYLDILGSDVEDEVITIDRMALANRLEAEFPDLERFKKDYAAIAESKGISEEEARARDDRIELNWDDDGYIQISVHDTAVGISHGFKGGRDMINMVERIFAFLREEGLHIWDPQGGDFLPPG